MQVTFNTWRLLHLFNSEGRYPESEFEGSTRCVRLRSADSDEEISPDRDWLSSEILFTSPVIGSHETPKNLQGESESFQESKRCKGSLSCFLNWRRASTSTEDREGDKRVEKKQQQSKKWRKESGCLAIGKIKEGKKGHFPVARSMWESLWFQKPQLWLRRSEGKKHIQTNHYNTINNTKSETKLRFKASIIEEWQRVFLPSYSLYYSFSLCLKSSNIIRMNQINNHLFGCWENFKSMIMTS